MKSTFRLILISLLPVFIGSLASWVMATWWTNVPVLLFRLDLAMLTFLTGLLVSFLAGAASFALFFTSRRHIRHLVKANIEHEESRRRFIRHLDHELKNPLTGLQAALANINSATNQQERQLSIENARISIDRLTRLLGDLRKLSELEHRPLEQLPVDVASLLEEMVEAACSLPAHADRKVNLLFSRVPWPLSPVTGDRDLLGLAFFNLLDNALKFTSSADIVEVRLFEQDRQMVIEVADTGCGIPVEDTTRIFEELYRGANARSIPGSGLGLALVRRIVMLHDGYIAVRSQQSSSPGTVFTLRLPLTYP